LKERKYYIVVTFILTILLLFLRGFSLEYGALVDPTESRYASVAQEMVISGDWITPHLPTTEKSYPYLGKPPLHYWLTALSYRFLKVDEWTSRLPSFICSILTILSFLILYPKKDSEVKNDFKSFGFIFLTSSALFFLFSGASVVDVTLTLFVTLTSICLYKAFETDKKYWFYLAAFFSALGFLTKGPVCIFLNGFSVIILAALERDLTKLKKIPYFSCFAILFLIISPWFYLAESANPGFIKYFFWNENFGRYFSSEYGDMYGSGHNYPRGMGLLMFLAGALPWSPFFLIVIYKWKKLLNAEYISDKGRYLFCCTLSPVILFSLARQLHFGYLIPAIPPFTFFLAELFSQNKEEKIYINLSLYIARALHLLTVGVIGYLLYIGQYYLLIPFIAGLSLVALYLSITSHLEMNILRQRCLSISISALAVYLGVLFPTLNLLDLTRSSERILLTIVPNLPAGTPEIGVITKNTFSHLWVGKNWREELGRPVKYIDISITQSHPQYLLIENKNLKMLDQYYVDNYVNKEKIGRWNWFERKNI